MIVPEDEPVTRWVLDEMEVAVATPSEGVVREGEVERTTDPEPVEVVVPVPPLRTGSAVPERVTASVPEVVMGEPEMDRKDGTVMATEVTVPIPPEPTVVQLIAVARPPCEVRTWPAVPAVVGKLKLYVPAAACP